MASFLKPLTWLDGIRRLRARKELPTTLGSRDLQMLDAGLKRWAVFSAKVENARALQKINQVVEELIKGVTPEDEAARAAGVRPLKLSLPDAKLKLRDTFEKLGVRTTDPDQIGTLQDPQSDARLSLIVETQEQLAHGYGTYMATQDEDLLDMWPCWELTRVSPSRVPRGLREGPQGAVQRVPGDSWPERWKKAGGEIYDGRMIALKNSVIWERLGDPTIFDDALGNPYPPFAFNSGMDVRDVTRDEAERLGVIKRNAPAPKPNKRAIDEDINASAANFEPALRRALDADPTLAMDGDVLTLAR